MKKIFVTLAIILGVTAAVVAQPRAIGARLGGDMDFSYQHSLGDNMLDLSAGIGIGHSSLAFGVAGAYDWLFPINSWDYAGDWTFYAGPAAGVFVRTNIGKNFPLEVCVGGQVGIEYAFDFPLNLSIDYRPLLNILGFTSGYWGHWGGLALGVRYRF